MTEKIREQVVPALVSGIPPLLLSDADCRGLSLPGLAFRHPGLIGSMLKDP